MKQPRLFFAAALSVFFIVLALPAGATTISAGDLVKLPDDGNPKTDADSAVYYVGTDGKRYAFPNSQTYFTWYADFSTVKTVSSSELAALQLGGNITYRPGTRLIKITTDPNVYAVEAGGQLRWIQSETVARGLYGDAWNQRVDDIPDAFFFNYAIAEPLAAAVYPDGTVVKRSSDGACFLINDRQKRHITTMDALTALRIQEKFILTTSSNLSDYPDAADLTGTETAITDTAQKNLAAVAAAATPTFTVIQPASSYIAVGSEATLMELNLSSAKAVELRQLTVRLDATTGTTPAAGETDEDKGGLVYGNNAQTNLRTLRWVDASGQEPFGRKETALDVNQDQSQASIWQGSWRLNAGETMKMYLRCQTNPNLPTGEGYKATLVVAGVQLIDGASGMATVFLPSIDLAGPALLTLNAALEVGGSGIPGRKTYIRGAKNALISGLSFKATTVSPNVIRSVTFQGYLDEESSGSFLPGSDADNGSETFVKDVVPQVSLCDQNGAKIAGPVTVDLYGKAAFSGMNYAISPGQTATLVICADLSATIELENQPDRVHFDVIDASTDLSVVDDKGAKVNALGQMPGGGEHPTYYATIKRRGKIEFKWQGSGGNAIAGREISLGQWSADPEDDDFTLKTIAFRQVGSAVTSIHSARLDYTGADGKTASVTRDFVGTGVTFSGLDVDLPRDKVSTMRLYATVSPKDAGVVYGEEIKVTFSAADPFEFVSQSDGSAFAGGDVGSTGDFTLTTSTSAWRVRYSGLAGAKAADSPTSVYREVQTKVFSFTLKAEPEGAVRVRKLTFMLSPSDAGNSATADPNDALENWSRLNGDFADDDGIANLRWHTTDGLQTIGEGSQASVKYCVIHGSTANCEPVTTGYASASGDKGRLTYDFGEGGEILIAAGTTQTYDLELDLTAMRSNYACNLTVELGGGSDLTWTDIVSGAYTALTGSNATGIPVSGGSVSVSK